MTAARTVPPCPEPAHPHGWIGYVVADCDRTRNVIRLARWAVLAAVLTLSIIVGGLVILALVSPAAAATLLAGSTAAGGVALNRLRRRHLRATKHRQAVRLYPGRPTPNSTTR
ncbi:hypothetical protein ACWEGE_35755 [Amycolatopsis sp. NPDC004747]